MDKIPDMSPKARRGLVFYFFLLIVISIFFAIYIWNPIEDSLHAQDTTNNIKYTDGGNKMINETVIKNETATTTITTIKENITQVNNQTRTNTVTKPMTGRAFFTTDPEYFFINRETRLIILAGLFGIIGASVQGIASLTSWISRGKLEQGWESWYLSRPPIGASLAIVTYLILRAGFVTGGPSAISDFGIAGISALVGIMTDEMTKKLRDIFDTLFGIQKPEHEKGEEPTKRPVSYIELKPENSRIKIGEKTKVNAKIIKSDGSPAVGFIINFTIKDNTFIAFTGTSNPTTDHKGNVTVEIEGKEIGETTLTARTNIEGETIVDEVTIIVI